MHARPTSWILIVLSACCVGDANAEAIRCDGCRPAAMRASARDAGLGTHHVYSLVERVVRSYDVVSSAGVTDVRAVPTPRDIALGVSGLWEILILSNGTMQVTINVPCDSLGLSAAEASEPGDTARGTHRCEQLLAARLVSGGIPSATEGVNALLEQARVFQGLRQGTRIVWRVLASGQLVGAYAYELGEDRVTTLIPSSSASGIRW